jgi:hypothetical protein
MSWSAHASVNTLRVDRISKSGGLGGVDVHFSILLDVCERVEQVREVVHGNRVGLVVPSVDTPVRKVTNAEESKVSVHGGRRVDEGSVRGGGERRNVITHLTLPFGRGMLLVMIAGRRPGSPEGLKRRKRRMRAMRELETKRTSR